MEYGVVLYLGPFAYWEAPDGLGPSFLARPLSSHLPAYCCSSLEMFLGVPQMLHLALPLASDALHS